MNAKLCKASWLFCNLLYKRNATVLCAKSEQFGTGIEPRISYVSFSRCVKEPGDFLHQHCL